MNAQELRIGNKVYGGLDEVLTVTGIRETVVDTNEGSSNIVGINPIPLSPELLEKCGFLDCTCKGWKLEGKKLFHINADMTFGSWGKVHHLHQLQNLIHALTGSEIEVNL